MVVVVVVELEEGLKPYTEEMMRKPASNVESAVISSIFINSVSMKKKIVVLKNQIIFVVQISVEKVGTALLKAEV